MKKESFVIGQKQCVIYHDDKPEYILLQPVNDHEMENLDRQVSLIKAEVSESFMFVAFLVERWYHRGTRRLSLGRRALERVPEKRCDLSVKN